LYDASVFGQVEGGQFRPAVVEAWIIGIVFSFRREQVFNVTLGDAAGVEGGVAFGRKGISVEGY
jgi:hypothetical protein